MTPDVRLNDSYEVATGKHVNLTVTIGQGQYGTSCVFLDGRPIATDQDDIAELAVGDGDAVRGKRLIVQSFVNDVQPNTNRMSVKYDLRGGALDQSFEADGNVTAEGETLYFRAVFDLV